MARILKIVLAAVCCTLEALPLGRSDTEAKSQSESFLAKAHIQEKLSKQKTGRSWWLWGDDDDGDGVDPVDYRFKNCEVRDCNGPWDPVTNAIPRTYCGKNTDEADTEACPCTCTDGFRNLSTKEQKLHKRCFRRPCKGGGDSLCLRSGGNALGKKYDREGILLDGEEISCLCGSDHCPFSSVAKIR